MVKKKKVSSENKTAIKATVLITLAFLLLAGIFLLFHKTKKIESLKPKPQVVRVVPKPIVPPVSKSKKPVVEKTFSGKGAKIAFILDDWGYRMSNCRYLKEIKAPLAIAVLPNLHHTNDIMKCANVYDKDIMLHLPLEPYINRDPYPDNYLITTKMPHANVEKLIDDTFKKMPLIIGVNNHMGSKATENKSLMRIVLRKIKDKGLFFVDSMTAPKHSICGELADEMKIPFAQRNVFLDNVDTREAIEKQFVELAQKARRKGYAIAIGHDRSLTMQILQEEIPVLQKQGFEIVHVKDLLRNKN